MLATCPHSSVFVFSKMGVEGGKVSTVVLFLVFYMMCAYVSVPGDK